MKRWLPLLLFFCLAPAFAARIPDEAMKTFYDSCLASCSQKAQGSGGREAECPALCQCASGRVQETMTLETVVENGMRLQSGLGPSEDFMRPLAEAAVFCAPKE